MQWTVNKQQRYAKMRAHTATHLLHAALWEQIDNVKQAGSLVDEDYVRFDFTSEGLLTEDQLKYITARVNYWIQQACDVVTKVSSYSDAVWSWAKAFFEDKYGDEVRVVSIKNEDDIDLSIELCWGTHVKNTAHIGSFVIVEHSSVASWVKRILAYTWVKVVDHVSALESRIEKVAKQVNVQPSQIEQKVEKIMKEYDSMIKTIDGLQQQQIISILEKISIGDSFFDVIVDVDKYDGLKNFDFKTIVQRAKDFLINKRVLIYNNTGSYALIWDGVKWFANKSWLQWWGSDNFVQWRDDKVSSMFV